MKDDELDIEFYGDYIEGVHCKEKLTLERLTGVILNLLCGEWNRSVFRTEVNKLSTYNEIRRYVDDLIKEGKLNYKVLGNVKIDSGMSTITGNNSYDFLYNLKCEDFFENEKAFSQPFVEVYYCMGTKGNEKRYKIDYQSTLLLEYSKIYDITIRINSQDFLPHLDRDKQSEFMKAIDEFWFVPCIKCNCFIFNEEGIKLVSQKILELLTKEYVEEPSKTEQINVMGETQAELR